MEKSDGMHHWSRSSAYMWLALDSPSQHDEAAQLASHFGRQRLSTIRLTSSGEKDFRMLERDDRRMGVRHL